MSDKSNLKEIKARVLYAARRKAKVFLDDQVLEAKISNKVKNLTVGDWALIRDNNLNKESKTKEDLLVTERVEPSNIFSRALGERTKEIANNLDRIFLITAYGSLFQIQFIDRILVAAYLRQIPCTILVNKLDLNTGENDKSINTYKELGYNLYPISAKHQEGLDELHKYISNTEHQHICFIGLSGVGKSTLLNHFIPEALRETKSVRAKSGTGQQTTSQSQGYLYDRSPDKALIISDPPGIQNFGLAYLEIPELKSAFFEFDKFKDNCEFRDCSHKNEENCAIKQGLEDELISAERYQSYISLYEEILRNRKY